ncbi:chaperone protein fimC [Klebsiella variicola]|uniref:Chaperone protein fimC n=1 Tax=Klebsiella variicola TaxID=244366 RepID=A0A7H4MQT2_KLEVA|nr:chaperone protein fimC [Klebsiella variicola]
MSQAWWLRFGQKTWPVSGHGAVKWRAINDYGGVSDFAQQ